MIYRCEQCKEIIKPDENRFRAMKKKCKCGLRWADHDWRNPIWVEVNDDGLTPEEEGKKWEADMRQNMLDDLFLVIHSDINNQQLNMVKFLDKWAPKRGNDEK